MSESKDKANIKAVVLVGGHNFWRVPQTSISHGALWPVADKTVLQRLIDSISNLGISDFVICSESGGEVLQNSLDLDGLNMRVVDSSLPRGTAGCILDAAEHGKDELLLVFAANVLMPPDIDAVLTEHKNNGADMTVVFAPSPGTQVPTAQMYLCESSILNYVPEVGYCDIKESLLPQLVQDGKTVNAFTMAESVGNYSSWRQYLGGMSELLGKADDSDAMLSGYKQIDRQRVWVCPDVQIDPSARLVGPIMVCEGAKISENAIILGPTVIGKDSFIGSGAMINESVLWDNTAIGENCEINNCVVDHGSVVPSDYIVEDELVTGKLNGKFKERSKKNSSVDRANILPCKISDAISSMKEKTPCWSRYAIWAVVLVLAFIWSYYSTIVDLCKIWIGSDEYSSGMLVPFIVLYILYDRRKQISECTIRPSLWGLLAFVLSQAFRGFGLFFMYGSAERLSLILSIISLTLFLFGWQIFRKVLPVLLFLFFMLPLPNRVHAAVMFPLQKLATASAIFCLELLGYAVIAEGNIIHINDTTVAVAEACNGLRMVTAFFVIVGLVVLIVKRPWWEKMIIMVSSLPIALLCNTIRLTVTSIAFTMIDGEKYAAAFHDFGGYAMMPVALGIVVLELWLLAKLMTVSGETSEVIVRRANA